MHKTLSLFSHEFWSKTRIETGKSSLFYHSKVRRDIVFMCFVCCVCVVCFVCRVLCDVCVFVCECDEYFPFAQTPENFRAGAAVIETSCPESADIVQSVLKLSCVEDKQLKVHWIPVIRVSCKCMWIEHLEKKKK